MIDREQVLHVARLARLELTEDEEGRMTGELSAILDHIEKISTLDLDGVRATPHVVDVPHRASAPGRAPPPASPSRPRCARTSRARRCRARSRWPTRRPSTKRASPS